MDADTADSVDAVAVKRARNAGEGDAAAPDAARAAGGSDAAGPIDSSGARAGADASDGPDAAKSAAVPAVKAGKKRKLVRTTVAVKAPGADPCPANWPPHPLLIRGAPAR